MKKIKFLLILVIIFLITILNIFLIKSAILGVVFGIIYLSKFSYFLGKNLFPEKDKCFSWILGLIFLLILTIICGTIIYYTIGLFNWSISLILLIPLIAIFLLYIKNISNLDESKLEIEVKEYKKKYIWFLDGIYLGLIIYLIHALFSHNTTEAIVSPWQVVPSYFFIIYFISTCLLLYKIFKFPEKLNLLLITIHTFLTSSIALIIYSIGYGFDPFIHRATEKIILENGYILPKNPFYIGQYSLVVILSKLFQISVSLIDKLLVPVLSSLIIPTLTYFSLLKLDLEKKLSQVTSLVLPFLILFTVFFTVPQHLANIFLIIFIFLTLIYFKDIVIKLNHLWLLAIAITCIHPLAGLPALMLVWLLSVRKKKVLTILSILLFLICIPIAFYFLSYILPGFDISLDLSNLKQRLISTFDFTYLPFHSFLHSIYFLKSLFPILIIILASLGFLQLYKKQKQFYIFPLISLILLVNSFLLSLFSFGSIIYYEQNIFPERLIHFAYFFALPFIIYAFSVCCHPERMERSGVSRRILWKVFGYKFLTIITISFITTSILYISYPTYDVIEKNKGYSVSQADIQAVHKIQEISSTDNFVVLANQSTSAAALQEFGFKKYFTNKDEQLFYYPIPTSSELYKIYLDISYKGIKDKYIQQVKDLTGADEIYIVFNDYWTNFKKLIPQGQTSAKKTYNINNKIWIFEY